MIFKALSGNKQPIPSFPRSAWERDDRSDPHWPHCTSVSSIEDPHADHSNQKFFLTRLSWLFVAMAIISSGGCGDGSKRGAVEGGVKLDGKPVENGSILFTPIQETRGAVAGGEIHNGRYRLSAKTGPAVGWNRVEIHAMLKTGKMVPKAFGAPGEMVPEQFEAVPPKFNSESTLKYEIKSGDNAADFEVSSR
jgi:hypothetical protein